jgi:hypothetical protein
VQRFVPKNSPMYSLHLDRCRRRGDE